MLKEISLVFAMHLHFRAFFLIPDATLKGYLTILLFFCLFFFFQAEDGIRDHCVTGVQTCALPISSSFFSTVRTPTLERAPSAPRLFLANSPPRNIPERSAESSPANLPPSSSTPKRDRKSVV